MDPSSSRRRSLLISDLAADLELEEGEYVPSDDYYESSADDTGHDDGAGRRMRRLEDIIAVPPPSSPTPTPSSESDEGTISDHRSGSSAGGAVVVEGGSGGARNKFACHVCGKAFSSRKAVDGHMRVHGSGSVAAAFSAGWAATGRRGWIGGNKQQPSAAAAAEGSLNSESTGQSPAIVAAQAQVVEPLEPVPMAFAMATNLSGEDDVGSSASATAPQPMHCDEPVAAAAAVVTTVAGANPSSSTGAGARAAAGPVDHQLAAADQAVQPLVPPIAAAAAVQLQLQQAGGQLDVVPRPAEPPQQEFSCKKCSKSYPTHQGLGGHAAWHSSREREQAAAMAAAAGVMVPHGGGGRGRGRRAEQPHACQRCPKVFPTGVALGGHMRMHYSGPKIVHKSKKRRMALDVAAVPPPAISEADLRLALANASKTEQPSSSSPSPAAPAVAGTGRLRLFGIDIGPLLGQQAPSEQRQGSGTTEEGSSSSAGEQQPHK